MFQIGLPLSFLLNPVGFTNNIITNIPKLSVSLFTKHELPKLPLSFISEKYDVVPKNLVLTEEERTFLATILVIEENSYIWEQETVKQSLCELWKNSRKNWIASSNAHRVFIRKRNFKTLAETFFNPNLESDLSPVTRDVFRHSCIYEPVAHETYLDVVIVTRNGEIVWKHGPNWPYVENHALKCKQTEEQGSEDYIWTQTFTFLWDYCQLFSFFCQDANKVGSNYAIIGCNLSKKHKLAMYKIQRRAKLHRS